MFGLFRKNKQPQNMLDSMIATMYGDTPPAKHADLSQAVDIANELLMGMIDEEEVSRLATELHDGPMPYSTHDLGLSVAVSFFKRPENVPNYFEAQVIARMKMIGWLEEGLVNPMLVQSFEGVLYELYKPGS